jgi:hypothetical protein
MKWVCNLIYKKFRKKLKRISKLIENEFKDK